MNNNPPNPYHESNKAFTELGKRFAAAFTQIKRVNIREKLLSDLLKIVQDAEFYAQVATAKRDNRKGKTLR